MARKDVLAAGYKSAQFAAGNNTGEIELKNMSSEPKEELVPVEIDRSRQVKRIVPKGDMVLVERREPEEMSAGGLFIPTETQAQDRPAEGVITAKGPDVEDVQVGDHVLFGRYSGTEYPFGDTVLLFMREEEIIGTVED